MSHPYRYHIPYKAKTAAFFKSHKALAFNIEHTAMMKDSRYVLLLSIHWFFSFMPSSGALICQTNKFFAFNNPTLSFQYRPPFCSFHPNEIPSGLCIFFRIMTPVATGLDIQIHKLLGQVLESMSNW